MCLNSQIRPTNEACGYRVHLVLLNIPEIRFSATLGKEPEVEVALV